MSENSSYLLDHASIFIAANTHTPIILEPNNLAANGIIPGDWENAESMLSMTESNINYSNGIRLLMNLESFQVIEPGKESFQDSYLIHKIADDFLEKHPHISYQNLGLNYLGGFPCDDPRQWLLERFTPSYMRPNGDIDVFAMLPRMFFDMGEELRALCKLELSGGNIERGGEKKSIVTINANMDHGGLSSAADIRAAIGLWREKQDFLISVLDKIFGEA